MQQEKSDFEMENSSVTRTNTRVIPTSPRASNDTHEEGLWTSILAALTKQKWLVLACTLLTLAIAIIYVSTQTPIYQAEVTIKLDPNPPAPLGKGVDQVVELGPGSYWATREYFGTQYKVIASRRIALQVVDELNLTKDAGFLANRKAPYKGPLPTKTRVEAAEILRSRLSVRPIKESRLVDVAYQDADKSRAMRILDAVAIAYITNNLDEARSSTSSALEWLREQQENLRSELNSSELALHKYKSERRISSIGIDDQATLLRREMEDLGAAKTAAQARLQAATARARQFDAIDETLPEKLPKLDIFNGTIIVSLQERYTDLVRKTKELEGQGYGINHPKMMAAQASRDATRDALINEIASMRQGAEHELAAVSREVSGLAALLDKAESAALDLNLMQIEYNRLKRTKDNNEKLYSLVTERAKQADLSKMLRVNNIRLLDGPVAAPTPVRPRKKLITLLAGLSGLALGLAGAMIRERADRSLKTMSDLETGLKVAALGAIPMVGLAKKRRSRKREAGLELSVHEDPTSRIAEAVRAIRTNILFMSPDNPYKTLLVTSAAPSEGKTTLACCLSVALAQSGRSVIIVDADMRRPRLHNVFSVDDGRSGLSEALFSPENLKFDPLATSIPNLSVLTAGVTPPNPSELLESHNFSRLLERLRNHFDMVLVDSPPLVVTDAAILSTKVDGSIVVVRANRTTRFVAETACRSILDVGGQIVGGILNAVDDKKSKYGYGYSYGGYGYSSTKSTEPKPADQKVP